MLYTSYFSNIKKILVEKPNMCFFSIAGKTPPWFFDINKSGKTQAFTLSDLMPKYEWWKVWHDKFEHDCESNESRSWYTAKYYETVLDVLDPNITCKKINELANGNDVCIVCYESSEKFCHRHIVSEWFNSAKISCSEYICKAKNSKNDITELSRLHSHSYKRVVINDNFVCEFVVPDKLEDWQEYCFFTEWYKEKNCPRVTCYADVIAYEYRTFKKHVGRIYLSLDEDLDKYSLSLALKDKGDKKWKTMHSVTEYELEEAMVPVNEFLKLLKYKPTHKVKEPYDSLGLSICEFKKHNGHSAHIEFGIDGKLYYEIIDERKYKEGDILPLDSPLRIDVIPYARITRDGMQELADKINDSLTRLYSIK